MEEEMYKDEFLLDDPEETDVPETEDEEEEEEVDPTATPDEEI